MTTNVCNLLSHSLVFACDSRWSYETDKFFYYIDNSGYDKICHTDKLIAVFAGNASVIEEFKYWIHNSLIGEMPSPQETSIIAYNRVKKSYFARNHSFVLPSPDNLEAIFSGSGSRDAMRSWKNNKCAEQAVRDACITDLYTGGSVKFFNILSGQHNISDAQLPLSELFNLLSTEGFVMKKQTPQLNTATIYPLKEVIDDPEIANDLFALKSGKASFDAPSPEAEMLWSKDEIQALSDFFQECK